MTLSVITTNNAETLVSEILAPGVFAFNLNYTGGVSSSGIFTGGLSAGLDFDSGIILTSGLASSATGSNGNGYELETSGAPDATPEINDGASTDLGLAGDADLSALSGFETLDAAALEFDFTSAGGNGSFTYVFSSEEYLDFENSAFNDVFAFFLDGQNIALLPDNSPVQINTVNSVENTDLFKRNINPVSFDIEYDGFTVALTANLNNLTPGAHHIKLAVADASDRILDSAVFIQAGSFDLNPLDITFDPVIIEENQSIATLTGKILGTIPTGVGGTFDYNLDINFGDPNNPDIRNFVLQDGGIGDTDNVDGTITFALNFDPHQYVDDQALADGSSPGNGTLNDLFATATVVDPQGQVASDENFITVNNVAPVLGDITWNPEIDENGAVTLTGNFTDPGSLDAHTVTINWGDSNDSVDTVLTLDPGEHTFVATHTYLDDGIAGTAIPGANFTSFDLSDITVTVADDDLGSTTSAFADAVKVNNVAPIIGTASNNLPALGIIVEGDQVDFNADYTDQGTLDYHEIAYNWGDGSPVESSVQVPLGGGVGHVTGSHVYDAEGIYTAALSVTDDDTNSDNAELDVIVARKVDIDWKPGSNPSSMNFTAGTVPVSILGSADFNVEEIDVASLRFDDEKDALLNGDGVGVSLKNNGIYQFSFEDTNSDGFMDLVAHVKATELGTVVNPYQDPFLTDGQIYAFGAYDSGYFFGAQQFGDPILIHG